MSRLGKLTALGVLWGASLSAQEVRKDNGLSLDIFTFEQKDNGGNPLRAEGFRYNSASLGARSRLNDEEIVDVQVNFAVIDNERVAELPATISNSRAQRTAASVDLTTLDFYGTYEVKRSEDNWTIRPGLFYHHQIDNIGAGFDFGGRRQFAGGNTELALNYGLRYDWILLDYWDRTQRGQDYRFSHNFLISWTELVSPSLKTNLSLQYSRQDGLLSEPFNYVIFYDNRDIADDIDDERLPNSRNRVQLNGRLRYSWALGQSLGVDANYYIDDWGIQSIAVEPSVELSLADNFRWRIWSRGAGQIAARYYVPRPQANAGHLTQDSDLGKFSMISPGTTFTWRLERQDMTDWLFRLSFFGFRRDDGIDGFGAKLGFEVAW